MPSVPFTFRKYMLPTGLAVPGFEPKARALPTELSRLVLSQVSVVSSIDDTFCWYRLKVPALLRFR